MNRINKVLQWNYVTAKYASKNIDKIWFSRFTNMVDSIYASNENVFKFNLTCKPTTDSHAFLRFAIMMKKCLSSHKVYHVIMTKHVYNV